MNKSEEKPSIKVVEMKKIEPKVVEVKEFKELSREKQEETVIALLGVVLPNFNGLSFPEKENIKESLKKMSDKELNSWFNFLSEAVKGPEKQKNPPPGLGELPRIRPSR